MKESSELETALVHIREMTDVLNLISRSTGILNKTDAKEFAEVAMQYSELLQNRMLHLDEARDAICDMVEMAAGTYLVHSKSTGKTKIHNIGFDQVLGAWGFLKGEKIDAETPVFITDKKGDVLYTDLKIEF